MSVVLAPPCWHVTGQREMLDALCARAYGPAPGAEHHTTEAVLAANPHLADQGPRIPQGVAIYFPAIAPRQPATAPKINLWS